MVAMEVSDCYGKSMVAMEVYGSVDLFWKVSGCYGSHKIAKGSHCLL
jgi:hypothetical protein